MLKFCARHNIKPKIEVLDLNEKNLNTAFESKQRFSLKKLPTNTIFRITKE